MEKVALAMILKDTEPLELLTRNLDSIGKAIDGIFYTITYSGDKVSKEAKELARSLKVYAIAKGYPEPEISYFKWVKDFAKARNFNFEQVPKEFEWIVWLDADDVFRGVDNLRKVVEMASNKFKAVFFNYLYMVEMTPDGRGVKEVLIEHLRERLIRNDGSYKWIGEIHETLIEQVATDKTDSDLCDVVHLSTDERRTEAIQRNIDILEEVLKGQGNKQDPRIVYYLGKAYFDLHTDENYDKADKYIEKYLEGSENNTMSGWEEERAQGWEYRGEIARIKGQFNRAIKCFVNALIENPKFPQFYIDMALVYVYIKRFDKALHWLELSQKVPYPKTTLVMNPKDMKTRSLEILFNIGVGTDNVEMAYGAMTKLLELYPNDAGVKARLDASAKAKLDNETVHRIVMITKFLNDSGNKDKVKYLLKALPDEYFGIPVIHSIKNDFIEPIKWEDKSIAIVCGRGYEKWCPENLLKGIGGSEEAVIYISRELAKLGYKVTVYGDPPESKDYGTVTYKNWFEFNPKDEFDILIGWRMPPFFDQELKARKKFLWLHDVQNPLDYPKERVAKIDKIFVLSEAHKRTLINDWNKEWLTEDKFLVTGNGIDTKMFRELKEEREPYRMIWTSSYDRGLEHLLKMWPEIKAKVSKATLHIFYGWNTFDTMFANNPERLAWKAKMNELMKQDGITHHGRISQFDLAKETAKSSIWAYPTHFYEISCITAMKCQAAGAIPVVTDFAALSETVQYGVKVPVTVTEDIYSKKIKEQYRDELTKMLLLGEDQELIRKPMMEWACNKFGWDKIAQQWKKEF